MPVPFSTSAPLNRLVTLVSGLASGLAVSIGVPESFSNQVSAYITIGGQTGINKATGGLIQRTLAYRVVFGYAVDGAESTAETTLATLVDAFMSAVYADQTLGGTLERVEVDASEADQPRYQLWSGSENREYPIRVSGAQRAVFPV
jgi:hypothetical protein